MQGKEFRGLAEAVTCAYGDDPWFFLRELAQNGRDAGARNLRVRAWRSPQGEETLSFADDGSGMTLSHARRFLFRLYASDKAADPAAAGRYGIGFWTILGFQPREILLQSRRGGSSWAVSLDAELTIRPAPGRLERPGTVITLTRPAQFASEGEFLSRVENGLLTYCRYLRRNDRRGRMLPLWFAGKNLTEPMTLPGPLSLSFRSGPVEGAVGLGEKPLVRLYARGLPVWQGAALNQMSLLQAEADVHVEFAPGLAPVFLLNGNHLDVTFSRSLALENKALAGLRKEAEAALRRLLESSLERAFPGKWHLRFADRLRRTGTRLLRPGWHWLPLVLLVLLPLELLVIGRYFPGRSGPGPHWFKPDAALVSYRGATVGPASAATPVPFSYRPGKPSWFRLFSADSYDAGSGFVRNASPGRLPAILAPPCPEPERMHMRLQAAGGETYLPLAPGHALEAGSLRLNGRPLATVFAAPQGETIAVLPVGGGILEYGSCPAHGPGDLPPAEFARLTALPAGVVLPATSAALLPAPWAPAAQKAAWALAWVRARLAYDTSPSTAKLYARLDQGQDWLTAVLAVGRGDCDVLNGLHVLLLRKMGVPARLVIGLTGSQGGVSPRLHAWSEYFDRGWRIADATFAGDPGSQVRAVFPPARTNSVPPPPLSGAGERALFRVPARSAFFLLLLLLAAAAGLILRQGGKWRTAERPPAEQMKKTLMQLVRHALSEPEAWGAESPLWSHRLLPTVANRPISIRRARRLLGKKELFMTANRNPLALSMAESGMTVLDLGEPGFAALGNLLAGAIDADRLCRLRPEAAPAGRDGELLAAVNGSLRNGWRKRPPCLLAPGLDGADFLRVSLPAHLRRPPFHFPRRFIAVNPAAAAYRHSLALLETNPSLAVIRFLRLLQAERMLDAAAAGLLRKSARRMLRQSHG